MKKDQAIESEFQPPKCPFVCTADEIKPYEEMKVSLVCNRHNNTIFSKLYAGNTNSEKVKI